MPTSPTTSTIPKPPEAMAGPAGALGVLAGGGTLPVRVAAAAAARGRPVFVVGLEGFAEPGLLAPFPHAFARIGAGGRIIELLRGAGVRELVLAGQVRRPGFFDLRPDAAGAALLARIGKAAFFGGDDTLLRAVGRVLEEEGFTLVGAHEILDGGTAPEGLLTRAAPDPGHEADILRGVQVARALGRVDVGQAVVVQQGLVLGVEAIEGTDALLTRVGLLARPGPGGVLVKLLKPGQDARLDMPMIGRGTVMNAVAAGLAGIAVEAGRTLLSDAPGLVAAADANGLFVVARHFPEA
jgi:hypothetical protein